MRIQLKDQDIFIWQSLEIFKHFIKLIWNKFSEKKPFSKKLEPHFVAESTALKKIIFPYKLAPSTANANPLVPGIH